MIAVTAELEAGPASRETCAGVVCAGPDGDAKAAAALAEGRGRA